MGKGLRAKQSNQTMEWIYCDTKRQLRLVLAQLAGVGSFIDREGQKHLIYSAGGKAMCHRAQCSNVN